MDLSRTKRSFFVALTVFCALLLMNVANASEGLNQVGSFETFTGCSNASEISQVDCEALVALYNSTDGPNWANRTLWLENDTPCTWYGVFCYNVTGGPRVYNLLLPSNGLKGTLPPEFWNLTHLTSLILYDNQLSGSIPSAISNLTNARQLLLDHNNFTGIIPPEIGLLVNLDQRLELDSNQLTGVIPPELANLTQLRVLELQFNQLSGGLPSEFGNMSGLQELSLYYNSMLNGPLPQSLTNLNLKFIGFDNTNLCEPSDAAFQTWLAGIPTVRRTGPCGDSSQTVTPWIASTLIYTSSVGVTTTMSVPAGAMTSTIFLTYNHLGIPQGIPSELESAGVVFALNAYQNGVLADNIQPIKPVTVTIEYAGATISQLDEATFALYTKIDGIWTDAASTCEPSSQYLRYPAEDRLTVEICHFSEFALLGQNIPQFDSSIFLPFVTTKNDNGE